MPFDYKFYITTPLYQEASYNEEIFKKKDDQPTELEQYQITFEYETEHEALCDIFTNASKAFQDNIYKLIMPIMYSYNSYVKSNSKTIKNNKTNSKTIKKYGEELFKAFYKGYVNGWLEYMQNCTAIIYAYCLLQPNTFRVFDRANISSIFTRGVIPSILQEEYLTGHGELRDFMDEHNEFINIYISYTAMAENILDLHDKTGLKFLTKCMVVFNENTLDDFAKWLLSYFEEVHAEFIDKAI